MSFINESEFLSLRSTSSNVRQDRKRWFTVRGSKEIPVEFHERSDKCIRKHWDSYRIWWTRHSSIDRRSRKTRESLLEFFFPESKSLEHKGLQMNIKRISMRIRVSHVSAAKRKDTQILPQCLCLFFFTSGSIHVSDQTVRSSFSAAGKTMKTTSRESLSCQSSELKGGRHNTRNVLQTLDAIQEETKGQ
jgi:hypothetical protein